MLGFVGAHYSELVIVAMSLFAAGLFSVSLLDSIKAAEKIDKTDR